MPNPTRYIVVASLGLFVGACSPKGVDSSESQQSSPEAKALADAASKAVVENPADALDLAASLTERNDLSSEDRKAAFDAQKEALQKLNKAAAAGDEAAKAAVEKFRARK